MIELDLKVRRLVQLNVKTKDEVCDACSKVNQWKTFVDRYEDGPGLYFKGLLKLPDVGKEQRIGGSFLKSRH